MFELLKSAPRFFAVMLVVCCMFFAHGTAHAQNPQLDCDAELTDPDQKWTAELCSAHAGCKLVFAIHKGCVKVKRFFTGLRDAIGEGTKTLFGYKKEITPDAIFEASLSDNLKAGSAKPEIAENAKIIKEKVRSARNDELSGQLQDGTTWNYYGDVVNGKATGVGTQIFSNGDIRRGDFLENRSEGLAETVMPEKTRRVGNFKKGLQELEGATLTEGGALYAGRYKEGRIVEGKLVLPSGQRFEGTFDKDSTPDIGKAYRANNTLMSEGKYEKNGALVEGKSYDSSGNATEVTILRDREAKVAADIAAANERARQEREQEVASKAAAEKQKADAIARDEQQFQASLKSMNAGQLFAKADEFKSQGDSAKSRDALRALITRFPDHALATTAAQQLSGNPSSAQSRPGITTSTNASSSGQGVTAGTVATFKSVCHRDWEKLREAVKQQTAGINSYGTSIRTHNLVIRLSERCASYDADSRRMVDSSRKSIKSNQDNAQRFCRKDAASCASEHDKSYQEDKFDQIYSAELAKAVADPNYSADLKGSVGGSSGASGSGTASSSSNKSGACDADLARIGNTLEQNQSRVGEGAVKSMELLLWSLSESIKVIDRSCPNDPKYIELRQSMQKSMATAKQACDGLSISPCVARLP